MLAMVPAAMPTRSSAGSRVFPGSGSCFSISSRLTKQTEAVLAEVCAFLDISAEGITLEEAERGKHGAYRVTGAGKLIRDAMEAMPGADRVQSQGCGAERG